jgi:glycosyltransferase involved in cell wall biosynthesis
MTHIFEESKCFISTQDFENFPSLAMNEAMAAGNAIISRNVGQTNLFVKHLINGVLTDSDTAEGLASAIEYYISHPQMHEGMQNESIRLTEEVHTFENFKFQIENFWDKTIHFN